MKKTLLIVDDELSIRILLEHFLGEEYNVITKEDGQKAFEWLEKGNRADLILSDIEMPVLNGFDLLIKIRENKKLGVIPCVVITGKGLPDNYEKTLRLGATDFIKKPFTPEEIKSKIEIILK